MESTPRNDWLLLLAFAAATLAAPIIAHPFGANYPDLLQKFAIYGIFAIGFNILFGLTGYLSFGHATFLGVGSYAAVWMFKLFTMNVIPAMPLSQALPASCTHPSCRPIFTWAWTFWCCHLSSW